MSGVQKSSESSYAASRPQTSIAYIRGLLEDCAKETTEEYQRRWPYHATVLLDAADARLLLAVLDGLAEEKP